MANKITFADLSLDDLDGMSLEGLRSLPLGRGNLGDTMNDHFRQLGKFIYADRLGREQTTALQKIVVGSVNQVRAADPTYYDDLTQAIMPFQVDMSVAVKASMAILSYAARACTNLLTKAIAVDLGLPAGSSLADVGAELVATMTEMSMSVAPTTADNPGGFAAYFSAVLGIALPTSDVPTIPDSYIDDDLT